MKLKFVSSLTVNRAKWLRIGIVLAVVLVFAHPYAMAGQSPVKLGSAESFAVLAGTTVTSTNGGTIAGDVGVWPGTIWVVGVPPVVVNGTVHLGDPTAASAQIDLTTAYNDAAGRSLDVILSNQELGSLTLAPGLYKSASGEFDITLVDLTLDAQGKSSAVWIFQMDSKLVVGSGRKVILTGGAQARNIFWQVGSSATIGTSAIFKGNILAYTEITLKTGARLDGRALARNAAVALDGNTLVKQRQFVDQPWRILFMGN